MSTAPRAAERKGPVGLARRYWVITLTLIAGLLCAGLAVAGDIDAARWLGSGYALAVAVAYTVRMVRSLASGRFGVDILAVTAIVATVAVGEVAAALIVVLMLSGGEALEDYADRRARRELNALLDRDPRLAHIEDADALHDVPIDSVRIGDVLLVRPAEIVPVDGVLLSPSTSLDQSSLTGESLPVEKRQGEQVLSGSVNGPEAVRIRATATAADSQYQQIVALVASASRSRPRVVRLADRYAVPFTVFSLLLAAAAWALSGDAHRFAEVLVLATPCPLLIAAPVAFIGGMSRAARQGIIVKNGGVFEQLAASRTVVFDKTGTLTLGRPMIREASPAIGFSSAEVLALAASAEQYSSHVLASSVIEAAVSRSLPLQPASEAEEHAADGVSARVGGRCVDVGTYRFIAGKSPDARRARLEPGQLAIYVAVDGSFAGTLVAHDPVRTDAAVTLSRLRAAGLRSIQLVTGDAAETAAGVAAAVGIDTVRAECLPGDKVQQVAGISERPVIMVGDGVNDAPVLAAADVGIAMGARGATAASESADVVLLVDDIGAVADAVAIGRRTVRVALQSIWVGITASVVLMCIAAFGLIPATVGALLQEAVDLATIVAALRALPVRIVRAHAAHRSDSLARLPQHRRVVLIGVRSESHDGSVRRDRSGDGILVTARENAEAGDGPGGRPLGRYGQHRVGRARFIRPCTRHR